MPNGVIGGTGGGACPGCGQYGNACKCHEAAQRLGEALALVSERDAIVAKLIDVTKRLDKYRTKCPTCRCRILPAEVCRCCAEPHCEADEPLV